MGLWHVAMAGILAVMYYVLIRVVLAHGWAEYHERGNRMRSIRRKLPDESILWASVAERRVKAGTYAVHPMGHGFHHHDSTACTRTGTDC